MNYTDIILGSAIGFIAVSLGWLLPSIAHRIKTRPEPVELPNPFALPERARQKIVRDAVRAHLDQHPQHSVAGGYCTECDWPFSHEDRSAP